jgi:hypothetical protein
MSVQLRDTKANIENQKKKKGKKKKEKLMIHPAWGPD